MKSAAIFLLFAFIVASAACTPVEAPPNAGTQPEPMDPTAQDAVADSDAGRPAPPVGATEVNGDPAQPTSTAAGQDAPQQLTPTMSAPAPTPGPMSVEETGEIYAAAIRQMVFVEHSFGGDPPQFPLVYIISITTAGKLLEAPASSPQQIDADLQGAIEIALKDRPFEIIWVPSREDVPEEENGQIAGGRGIYLILGNILPREDGTIQLPMHMVCGTLCLSGKNYVLEQIDDTWQVTGSVGMVIEA